MEISDIIANNLIIFEGIAILLLICAWKMGGLKWE